MLRSKSNATTLVLASLAAAWAGVVLLGVGFSTRAVERALEPWFALCRWMTPEAWQTRGNVMLGALWLVSGVTAYGLLLAIVLVAVMRRRPVDEAP